MNTQKRSLAYITGHKYGTSWYIYIYHEYLERLTRTGPKRLHVLFKHILSKFSVYNMNAHAHTQTRTYTYAHTHAQTHTHTPVAYQGNQDNETEDKVFKKRFSRKI